MSTDIGIDAIDIIGGISWTWFVAWFLIVYFVVNTFLHWSNKLKENLKKKALEVFTVTRSVNYFWLDSLIDRAMKIE